MMSYDTIANFFSIPVVKASTVLLVGMAVVFLGSSWAQRATSKKLGIHHAQIIKKLILYIGFVLVVATSLIQMGVNLTAVLGAAGVMTAAVAFASQTSLSNIIAGWFLILEKPFAIGDVILVNDTRGVVMSIDLLSVKMRTLDNLYIRMPNTTVLTSKVTTVTRFPIRRMDVDVGVAYKEDVTRVMEILREIADKNPFSLDEPEPLILFKDFGSSSLNFLLGVWFEKSNFLKLKNSIMEEIKRRFDEEGIEIPFPHLTIYTGSETTPFPVEVFDPSKDALPLEKEK